VKKNRATQPDRELIFGEFDPNAGDVFKDADLSALIARHGEHVAEDTAVAEQNAPFKIYDNEPVKQIDGTVERLDKTEPPSVIETIVDTVKQDISPPEPPKPPQPRQPQPPRKNSSQKLHRGKAYIKIAQGAETQRKQEAVIEALQHSLDDGNASTSEEDALKALQSSLDAGAASSAQDTSIETQPVPLPPPKKPRHKKSTETPTENPVVDIAEKLLSDLEEAQAVSPPPVPPAPPAPPAPPSPAPPSSRSRGTGTAFDLSFDTTKGTAAISSMQQTLSLAEGKLRKMFHSAGHGLVVDKTGIEGGNFRIATDAGRQSELVQMARAQLEAGLINRNLDELGTLTESDANVRTRNRAFASNRAELAVRSMGQNEAVDTMRDRNTGMTTMFYETGNRRVTGRIGDQVRRDNDYIREQDDFLAPFIRQENRYNALERFVETHPNSRIAHRHREMIPGTEEFREREFTKIHAREERNRAFDEFIRANPNSQTAMDADTKNVKAGEAKAKRGASIAAAVVKMAVFDTIKIIMSLMSLTVNILGKVYQTLTNIGSDVRQQLLLGEKHNLDPGFVKKWNIRAKQEDIDPEILFRALSTHQRRFGSVLHLDENALVGLAPYIRDKISELLNVSSMEVGGKSNPMQGMSLIIDDFLTNAWQGKVGTHTFKGSEIERRGAAYRETASVLGTLNGDMAFMAAQYWHTLETLNKNNKLDFKEGSFYLKDTNQKYDFWSYVENNPLPEFDRKSGHGNAITTNSVLETADATYRSINSMLAAFTTLRDDVLKLFLSAKGDDMVEEFRRFVTTWIARYFPAFALKENERALRLNTESMAWIEANEGNIKAEAEKYMKRTGFTGSFEEFEELFMRLMSVNPATRRAAATELFASDPGFKYTDFEMGQGFMHTHLQIQADKAYIKSQFKAYDDGIKSGKSHQMAAKIVDIPHLLTEALWEGNIGAARIRDAFENMNAAVEIKLNPFEKVLMCIVELFKASSAAVEGGLSVGTDAEWGTIVDEFKDDSIEEYKSRVAHTATVDDQFKERVKLLDKYNREIDAAAGRKDNREVLRLQKELQVEYDKVATTANNYPDLLYTSRTEGEKMFSVFGLSKDYIDAIPEQERRVDARQDSDNLRFRAGVQEAQQRSNEQQELMLRLDAGARAIATKYNIAEITGFKSLLESGVLEKPALLELINGTYGGPDALNVTWNLNVHGRKQTEKQTFSGDITNKDGTFEVTTENYDEFWNSYNTEPR